MIVTRVRKLAMKIAKTLQDPDMVVVELAALFHDMAGEECMNALSCC